ncbi:MAG TPA: hypothetical protein VES95_07785 [Dermatophilaceae bacterium]|nr:hypothetical protein [Dermatophilaceae bacterium]
MLGASGDESSDPETAQGDGEAPGHQEAGHASPQNGMSAALQILGTLLTKAVADQGATLGATPEQAGAAWAQQHISVRVDDTPAGTPGQWLAKLDTLLDVLRDWGYSPELRGTEDGKSAEVRLHGCPFDTLAAENPDVVCGVHLGLLSGALAVLGEPGTRVSLDPFIAPRLCRARFLHVAPEQEAVEPPQRP